MCCNGNLGRGDYQCLNRYILNVYKLQRGLHRFGFSGFGAGDKRQGNLTHGFMPLV